MAVAAACNRSPNVQAQTEPWKTRQRTKHVSSPPNLLSPFFFFFFFGVLFFLSPIPHTHTMLAPCSMLHAPCIRPVPRRARPRPCSHPLLSCKVSLARHARRSRLRRWAAIHPTAHAIRYSDPIPIRAFVMYRMWLQAQSTRDVALALIAWANETRARLFVTVAPCGRPSPEPDAMGGVKLSAPQRRP